MLDAGLPLDNDVEFSRGKKRIGGKKGKGKRGGSSLLCVSAVSLAFAAVLVAVCVFISRQTPR